MAAFGEYPQDRLPMSEDRAEVLRLREVNRELRARIRELESASQPGGGEAEALAEDAARWRHIYNGRYVICRWSAEDKAYVNIGGSYVGRDAIDALRAAPSAGNGGSEGDAENSAVITADSAVNSRAGVLDQIIHNQ